jgi:hypothetical protein
VLRLRTERFERDSVLPRLFIGITDSKVRAQRARRDVSPTGSFQFGITSDKLIKSAESDSMNRCITPRAFKGGEIEAVEARYLSSKGCLVPDCPR